MKHFTRIITLLSITIAFCACTEEFIDLTPVIDEGSAEGIMISPQWDAADYQFKCAGIKDASFSIVSKPSWLTIQSNSGKFTDSAASIHAKAILESRFSKAGFHNDQMVIMSGAKSYNIPLTYISEGNPSVEVKWGINYRYDAFYNNVLNILNSVDGVLIWDIVSLPSWLKVNMEYFDTKTLILEKGGVTFIPLDLNIWEPVQGVLTGTIVLKTNVKSKPLIEIPVSANLGTPDIAIITWPIDFGSSETSKTVSFTNHGGGILCWRFEELPEWLTVSPASGMILPDGGGSGNATFTCDRGKLQNSSSSATVKLKSNDPDRPSVDLVFNVLRPGV